MPTVTQDFPNGVVTIELPDRDSELTYISLTLDGLKITVHFDKDSQVIQFDQYLQHYDPSHPLTFINIIGWCEARKIKVDTKVLVAWYLPGFWGLHRILYLYRKSPQYRTTINPVRWAYKKAEGT